jgi:hypothetical protein
MSLHDDCLPFSSRLGKAHIGIVRMQLKMQSGAGQRASGQVSFKKLGSVAPLSRSVRAAATPAQRQEVQPAAAVVSKAQQLVARLASGAGAAVLSAALLVSGKDGALRGGA